MFKKGAIMGIYSMSPVHAGSGNEISYIDLPIQREKHTGFPTIWGQSLKGVLRDAYKVVEERDNVSLNVKDIFGPEKGGERMGRISVGDARVLLFPVRSARGLFVYVTSPTVLKRFDSDLKYLNNNEKIDVPDGEDDEIIVESKEGFVGNMDGKAILEDFAFEIKEKNKIKEIFKKINNISPVKLDIERFAVVSDDTFKYFVKNTTEILPRVAIDDDKGTVRAGALWWEEYLPTDTLLYSVILAKDCKNNSTTADAVFNALSKFNEWSYIQIGGNSTVGKGICKIKISPESNSKEDQGGGENDGKH